MTHVHRGTISSKYCQDCGASKANLHYAMFEASTEALSQRDLAVTKEPMTWLNPQDEGYPQPPLDKWQAIDICVDCDVYVNGDHLSLDDALMVEELRSVEWLADA